MVKITTIRPSMRNTDHYFAEVWINPNDISAIEKLIDPNYPSQQSHIYCKNGGGYRCIHKAEDLVRMVDDAKG